MAIVKIPEHQLDLTNTNAAIASKQNALTETQLAAVNSGADSTKIAQIATNAGNISSLSSNKLDKTEAATTYATQTSVTSDLALKQPKTLDTSLTIGGVSQTTVEGALGAINTFVETKKSGVVFRTWED